MHLLMPGYAVVAGLSACLFMRASIELCTFPLLFWIKPKCEFCSPNEERNIHKPTLFFFFGFVLVFRFFFFSSSPQHINNLHFDQCYSRGSVFLQCRLKGVTKGATVVQRDEVGGNLLEFSNNYFGGNRC